MKENTKQNNKAFTLIEILLYISMVSIIVLAISSFFVLIQRVKVKNEVIATVNNEGQFVSSIIERTIRESTSVITPTSDTPTNVLSLPNSDGSRTEEKINSDGNFEIANYDSDNNLLSKIPLTDNQISVSSPIDPIYHFQWGSEGYDNGQFRSFRGIATDSSGNVYVADTNNYRIQKFTSDGQYITQWGGYGNHYFHYPYGIATDSSGNVYVADTGNNRIQVFSPAIFSIESNGGIPYISYNFTLKAKNLGSGYEYNYSKNFSGGATLRVTPSLPE